MSADQLIRFPVGFKRFHRRPFINYQLNRAYALGYADEEELRAAAATFRSGEDAVEVFEGLSATAERGGRFRQATGYLRLAEFFTPPKCADKVRRYVRYRSLFDTAFGGNGITRHEVAYDGSALPAYRLPAMAGPSGGTVLLHGGFDSLIEEFLGIWQRIAAASFDVVAFEGPGQGGARRLGGLTSTHDWERPVGTVLDHFGLTSAGLVGISMGGYWAIRAASCEPRIARVVAWPPVFDWLYRLPGALRGPVKGMLARRHLMRWSIRARARLIPTLRQVVDQVGYITDSDDPVEVVDWFLGMNDAHLGSHRLTQDVLLLAGEDDRFQPLVLARAQQKALSRARSVTSRTFTANEHAGQHCQMGNLELACTVLTTWLRQPSPGAPSR